jgi:hypothetical protein
MCLNGATCLSMLARGQDNVSEWGDMSIFVGSESG